MVESYCERACRDGYRSRRQGGIVLPKSAPLPGSLLRDNENWRGSRADQRVGETREIAYHLTDSDAKAVFVFEDVPDLPMARNAKEGFDQVSSCSTLVIITKDGETPSAFPEFSTLAQVTEGQSNDFEIFPTRPDDTCAILYTSGTTGQPKGAELTHMNLMTNVTTTWATQLPAMDFTDGVQKTCLITLPLFHTTGQTVQMNTNLYGGCRVVLLPKFDARTTLDAMIREKVNFWIGVPTMYWAIAQVRRRTRL